MGQRATWLLFVQLLIFFHSMGVVVNQLSAPGSSAAEAMAESLGVRINAGIRAVIPNFYDYRYDGPVPQNQITDGGNDMYDGGNRVTYYKNGGRGTRITYNRNYRVDGDSFSSLTSRPFLALWWINNNAQRIGNYTIQVQGNAGADGRGSISSESGTVNRRGYSILFRNFQVYGARDPSICEVYFAVSSRRPEWTSSTGFSFTFRQLSTGTDRLNNHIVLNGRPRNVLFGYMLLSRAGGAQVTRQQIIGSLNLLADSLTGAQNTAFVNRVGNAIRSQQGTISRGIRNWYRYRYDGINPQTQINDGGNDMFDGGNILDLFFNQRRPLRLVYGRSYGYVGLQTTTRSISPFINIIWVDGTNAPQRVRLQVTGDPGSDGQGRTSSLPWQGNSLGNYRYEFTAYQIFSAQNDPTICEVYFAFYNSKDLATTDYRRPVVSFNGNSARLNTTVDFRTGRRGLRNTMIGYTLLSKHPSSQFTLREIENVVLAILRIVRSVDRRTAANFASTALDAVVPELSFAITSLVPGWFNYRYDATPNNRIVDGGNDMYDSGNIVTYFKNGNRGTRITYGVNYRVDDDDFSSRPSHPFMAFWWVENANYAGTNYTLQVRGNAGADGRGRMTTGQGNVVSGAFTVRYNYFQVWGAGNDPSICEVYYLVESTDRAWSSHGRYNFRFSSFSRNTNDLNNQVSLTGRPERVMIGYTLLSKSSGRQVTNVEIQNTVRFIANALDRAYTQTIFSNLFTILDARQRQIQRQIPRWYNYRYDQNAIRVSRINDGGNDMFDGGNILNVRRNGGGQTLLLYNRTYAFPGVQIATRAVHPFANFYWLDNNNNPLNLWYSVTGNPGSDGGGRDARILRQVRVFDNYRYEYSAFQIFGAGNDPTICEVYFTVYNPRGWNTRGTQRQSVSINGDRRLTNTTVTIRSGRGVLQNALLGYTLLSRHPSAQISNSQIENAVVAILRTITDSGFIGRTTGNLGQRAIDAVIPAYRGSIRGTIPNWYSYIYDSRIPNQISDGGNDMYDGGNRVYLYKNGGSATQISYNQNYRFGDDEASSLATHPFLTLWWIENSRAGTRPVNYTIQVRGDSGADRRGNSQTGRGSIIRGTFTLTYRFFQVYNAFNDPSICEVFFVISSSRPDWSSRRTFTFNFRRFGTNTNDLFEQAELTGNPSRVLIGYTLLSRVRGAMVTAPQIRSALSVLLRSLETGFTPRPPIRPVGPGGNFVQRLFSAFQRQDSSISSGIRNWYRYIYDDRSPRPTRIIDGGRDMYDGGNMLSLRIGNGRAQSLVYGQVLSNSGMQYGTRAGNPFVALFWLGNSPASLQLRLQVTGNPGSDGFGRTVSGRLRSVNFGNYLARFRAFQLYDARDPSICQIVFAIFNPRNWNSVGSSLPFVQFNGNTNQLSFDYNFNRNSRYRNVLIGYTLVSKFPTAEFTDRELDDIMRRILRIISTVPR